MAAVRTYVLRICWSLLMHVSHMCVCSACMYDACMYDACMYDACMYDACMYVLCMYVWCIYDGYLTVWNASSCVACPEVTYAAFLYNGELLCWFAQCIHAGHSASSTCYDWSGALEMVCTSKQMGSYLAIASDRCECCADQCTAEWQLLQHHVCAKQPGSDCDHQPYLNRYHCWWRLQRCQCNKHRNHSLWGEAALLHLLLFLCILHLLCIRCGHHGSWR